MIRSQSMRSVFRMVVFFVGIYQSISYEIDSNQLLNELLRPQANPSLQIQALRKELLRRVQEALDRLDEEERYQQLNNAIGRWNSLPDKRNLEALARAGYIKTLPESEDEDANYKRSIANLAKNGQLPKRPEEQKRGIESLARNGELRLRNLQSLLTNLSEKKHLSSLVKSSNLPLIGKKSLSSLAKSGDLNARQHIQYKRSAVTSSQTLTGKNKQSDRNKRPTGAEAKRDKRDADYYYENDENYYPFYQNEDDYDDLIQDLHAAYPEVGKRFLGSVVRSGWYRPSSSSNWPELSPEKRHIGSLARLGWLPSFRHIRRFNRAGRAMGLTDSCRAPSTDGKTEIYGKPEDTSLLLKCIYKYLQATPSKSVSTKRIFHHPIPGMRRFF